MTTMQNHLLCVPRSLLFVSGEKPERFPKAFATDADLVCIDLEDAVHPQRKTEARVAVLQFLREVETGADARVALRINALRTPDGLQDLAAFVDSGVRIDWLLLPKAEDAADVQCVAAWAGSQIGHIAALIETPLGIERAAQIAQAGAPLGALMLGGADLATELGAQFNWEALWSARARLVNAARSAGLQAWDVPHVDLDQPDELASETRRALALGFDCKTAIHPKQLAAIHAAHVPTEAEQAWARLLVEAVPEGQSSGAFLYQGRMVDAPLLRKARRIVELAQRT